MNSKIFKHLRTNTLEYIIIANDTQSLYYTLISKVTNTIINQPFMPFMVSNN